MTPSKYQQAIFQEIENGTSNLMVEAVAGSGKTTTIVKSLEKLSPVDTALFVAFNKHIADELKKRVPRNVEVATLNGFGWRICLRQWGKIELDDKKVLKLIRGIAPHQTRWFGTIAKTIGLLKATTTRDNWTQAADISDQRILIIAEQYDIDLPSSYEVKQFCQIVRTVFAANYGNPRIMDFDDQLFMPIAYDLKVPQYDVVMVDEAQDLSAVQVQLVSRAGRRIIAVGDSRQAIYGFRGADPDAMPRMADRLKMKRLPLSICYRCPKKHIALAKEIVPQIEASDTAADGEVQDVKVEELHQHAKAGDYVLCRTTAPLVKHCLKMIGKGIKATVKGRDFATALISFIEKIGNMAGTIEEFIRALREYVEREERKLIEAERDPQPLLDRQECLLILAEGCTHAAQLPAKIESIFSDGTSVGVTFATVHRSKGLEGDNIFILRPDLLPFPLRKAKDWQKAQEQNLKYVALTRGKKKLVFLEGE